jgi:UDP-N-acetylmuramoylalanine--D-glutamate ligase
MGLPVQAGPADIRGKRVSVIGAARSGVAAAAMLQRHGATVFVSDSAPAEKIRARTDELRSLGIEYETGGNTARLLEADLIVISPGVPSGLPVIREAAKRGMDIVSELEADSWFCPVPILAVTGTNGKTTTTTLLDRLLNDARLHPVTAGNIGTAFSSLVDGITTDSFAVLEVSSFQLDFIRRFRPAVAVLLNITPDHLDRYDHDFSKYSDAKCRVFENQGAGDVLVYNDDDPETRRQVLQKAAGGMKILPFALERKSEEGAFVENGALVTVVGGKRTEIIETGMISIRGTHNLYNSMAAVLAAQSVQASVPSIRATLRNFRGVEHRLEFVREVDGVTYVNDSKATNVDSVWYALQSFHEPIIVMLGGRDKGNDYSRLNDLVKKHVKAIVAIGESAQAVVAAFGGMAKVVTAGTMQEAVDTARGLAAAGDVVLLSPACASFDWFENYEHRGRVFKEIVNGIH